MSADLVVFGEDWGRHPSSTQHLVQRLGRDRKVVWVNSIGLRRPRVSWRDLRRLAEKGRAMVSPVPRRPDRDPLVVSPRVAPAPGSRIARRVNRRLLAGQIGRVLARENIRRPILWASLPTAVDMVGALGERAVIYYCGDDFAALEGVDHSAVGPMEQQLAARADLILAASPVLADKFPPAKTRLAPHGVDFDLFATPTRPALDLPTGRPVAGFYGSIAEWVNLDLIAATAARLPNWMFVMIGPVRADLRPLRNLENVRLLGERRHDQLPGYVQHWTASLLPFHNTRQIHACNPLKLREYMAAGRPVVATDFPALDGYRDFVRIAEDPERFAAALVAAETENPKHRAARRARVSGESWDARARTIADLLAVFE